VASGRGFNASFKYTETARPEILKVILRWTMILNGVAAAVSNRTSYAALTRD
jgi:hypothetical protein